MLKKIMYLFIPKSQDHESLIQICSSINVGSYIVVAYFGLFLACKLIPGDKREAF